MRDVLQLVNATVMKGGVRALDDLTLTVAEGEHTAIIGPNGSGKSTLINLLTHDDRARAADEAAVPPVRVFGSDRWAISELRTMLGVVSADLQHRFVNGNSAGRILARDAVLSGFFAAYGFVPAHAVTEDMRRRTTEALMQMAVSHLSEVPLHRMSTGEARRVLIARALVTAPRALVLDEPTSGLDVVARRQFLTTVRRIARQGTTLIIVTHRVEEIVPEVTHVVLLRRGRVVAAGVKAATLTETNLSAAFGAPVTLEETDGYYLVRV